MKQLMAEYKAIKDGKSLTRKMCKWGDDCKYQYKCRFTHPGDLRKEEEEKAALNVEQLGKYTPIPLPMLCTCVSNDFGAVTRLGFPSISLQFVCI